MKQLNKFIATSCIALAVLAGCSDKTGKQSDISKKDPSSDGPTFKEVESFDIDGQVSQIDLTLDESGEIFFWNEQDQKLSDPQRKKVRMLEDETITLEDDQFKLGTSLLPSGKIYTDRSKFSEDQYKMAIFDPRTKEETELELPSNVTEYVMPILHTNSETINEEDHMYLHFQTETDNDAVTFLWNFDTGEANAISLMQDLRDAHNGEEVDYPRLQLSSDSKKVFVLIDNDGIYEYDVESEELTLLLENGHIQFPITYSSMVTSDDQYIPYIDEIVKNEDKPFDRTKLDMKLLNVETKESIDVGIVKRVFPINDGNIILYKEEGIFLYDIESEEETLIHPVELSENEELVDLSVSGNGETIVTIIETEEEDEEGEKVISQKAYVYKKS